MEDLPREHFKGLGFRVWWGIGFRDKFKLGSGLGLQGSRLKGKLGLEVSALRLKIFGLEAGELAVQAEYRPR